MSAVVKWIWLFAFKAPPEKGFFFPFFSLLCTYGKWRKKRIPFPLQLNFNSKKIYLILCQKLVAKKCVVLKWYTQTYFQITKAHCIEWYTSNILSTNDSKCIINSTNLTRLPVVIPYFFVSQSQTNRFGFTYSAGHQKMRKK